MCGHWGSRPRDTRRPDTAAAATGGAAGRHLQVCLRALRPSLELRPNQTERSGRSCGDLMMVDGARTVRAMDLGRQVVVEVPPFRGPFAFCGVGVAGTGGGSCHKQSSGSGVAGLVKPWAVRRSTCGRLSVGFDTGCRTRPLWCQAPVSSDRGDDGVDDVAGLTAARRSRRGRRTAPGLLGHRLILGEGEPVELLECPSRHVTTGARRTAFRGGPAGARFREARVRGSVRRGGDISASPGSRNERRGNRPTLRHPIWVLCYVAGAIVRVLVRNVGRS